jgi:ankyrin repeat protein
LAQKFIVKDFKNKMQEFAHEILANALSMPVRTPTSKGAQDVSNVIFLQLCDQIHTGFLSDHEDWKKVEQFNFYPQFLIPLQSTSPSSDLSLIYRSRMLDLSCFLDPTNHKKNIIRLVSIRSDPDWKPNPDEQLANADEYLNELDLYSQQPDFDAAFFVMGINAGVITSAGGWQTPRKQLPNDTNFWSYNVSLDSDETAKHEKLVERFSKLLARTVPSVNRQFQKAGLRPWDVCDVTFYGLFGSVEGESWSPSVRLTFLENVWPLINEKRREEMLHPQGISQPNFTGMFNRLGEEIGDRKRVQNILITPPLPNLLPPVLPPSPASISQGSHQAFLNFRQNFLNQYSPPPEPLLSNIKLTKAPGLVDEVYIPDINPAFHLKSFADQLILGPMRYDLSTSQIKPLSDNPRYNSFFEALSNERLLYSVKDGLGWLDLISGETGKLSLDQGMPLNNPSMVGAAGPRYLFVGGGTPHLAGYYDWQKKQWLNPAHDGLLESNPPAAGGEAIGNDKWMLFPQWSMIYNRKTGTWRDLSALTVSAGDQKAAPAEKISMYFGRALALNGDFLLWNESGIIQYSPDKNRVIWSAKSVDLEDVALDGPYIWLLFCDARGISAEFGSSHPMAFESIPETSNILLLRNTDKIVLGAWDIPCVSWSISLGDEDVWLCSVKKRPDNVSVTAPSHENLIWHGEKKDFYAALNLMPPSRNQIPSRPACFHLNGASLYEALIRHDVNGVRKLLYQGISPNSLVGVDHAPALNVAIWSCDADMVKLLLSHGIDLAQAPTALDMAAKQKDPTMAGLLINAGADIKGKGPDISPLLEAVRYHNINMVELLAKAGAPLLQFDSAGNLYDPHGGARYGPDIIALVKDSAMARRLLELYPQLPLYWKNCLEKIAYPDAPVTADPNLTTDLDKLCAAIADESTPPDRADELIHLIPRNQLDDPRVKTLAANGIANGLVKIVSALLDRGVDLQKVIKSAWPNPKKPLSFYLNPSRHADMILFLVAHGYDPTRDSTIEPVGLMNLAYGDHDPKLWEVLLKPDLDLNQKCGYGTVGCFALCEAVNGLNEVAVKALLEHGANPNAVGHDGYSPLQLAFVVESPALASILAGSGADLDFRDLCGKTVFDLPYLLDASDSKFLEEVRNYQPQDDVEKKGRKNLMEALNRRPTYRELFDAVTRGDAVRVNDLIDRKAPVNNSREMYQKPGLVFLAAQANRPDLVQILLDHGCDPNIGDRGVDNPNLAFSKDSNGIRGAPVLATCHHCQSPLMEAAKLGNADIVRLLLDHGAYAPEQDEFGRTAIDESANQEIASQIEERTRVQFLAEKLRSAVIPGLPIPPNWPDLDAIHQILRTDPLCVNVRNTSGDIPLLLVANYLSDQNKQILKLFHESGCGMDALDSAGMTPLHRAILDDDEQRASDLVKVGFNPLTPDSRGITALDLAEGILGEESRTKMVVILQNTGSLFHSDTENHPKLPQR